MSSSDAALDRLGSTAAEFPPPASAASAAAMHLQPPAIVAPSDSDAAPATGGAHGAAAEEAAAAAACVSVLPAHPYDEDVNGGGVAASTWSRAARDAPCGEEVRTAPEPSAAVRPASRCPSTLPRCGPR
jgi:hypothetical protein